jgi:hypothetical protein
MSNVLIATPTPGSVKASYTETIARTLINLTSGGIGVAYMFAEGGDLIIQRNNLAARFLAQPRATHLFFVDGDMSFEPTLCRRMLDSDKAVIGAVYSARQYLPDGKLIWYAFKDVIPLGAALIRRDVFETMIERGVAIRQQSSYGSTPVYNFFGPRPADTADGQHYSDDHSFCRRWTIDCGGEVHAIADAEVFHIGDYKYGGRFVDALKPQDAQG